MAMGACPGQIPMPCVPPALMVTATMVRACRYIRYGRILNAIFRYGETPSEKRKRIIILLCEKVSMNFCKSLNG